MGTDRIVCNMTFVIEIGYTSRFVIIQKLETINLCGISKNLLRKFIVSKVYCISSKPLLYFLLKFMSNGSKHLQYKHRHAYCKLHMHAPIIISRI